MNDYSHQPPRYRQLSEDTEKHQCSSFQIAATDMTIVRWCPTCGKTWRVIRYAQGGLFTGTWEEIKEP